MVVVHPDQRRPVRLVLLLLVDLLQRPDRLRREFLVDRGIRAPVLGDEGRPVGHRMEQRPEGSIAASVVV